MATYDIDDGYAPSYSYALPQELWTEVLPGLWQGGTADDDTIADPVRDLYRGRRAITKDEFDAVVTLYAWARPVDWEVEELRWGFYDSEQLPDAETLRETVEWAHRRWAAGKRVLVRCQLGANRSGLVTALVLMRSGMTAEDAIALQREKRGEVVLCNADFEIALYEMDAEGVVERW